MCGRCNIIVDAHTSHPAVTAQEYQSMEMWYEVENILFICTF